MVKSTASACIQWSPNTSGSFENLAKTSKNLAKTFKNFAKFWKQKHLFAKLFLQIFFFRVCCILPCHKLCKWVLLSNTPSCPLSALSALRIFSLLYLLPQLFQLLQRRKVLSDKENDLLKVCLQEAL